MAGNDFKRQSQVRIIDFIVKELRTLLDRPTNQYQDPNWDQAMSLFLDVVVPCGLAYGTDKEMLQLAKDILERVNDNNGRVYYVRNDDTHKNFFDKTHQDYEFLHNTQIRTRIRELEDWLEKYKD